MAPVRRTEDAGDGSGFGAGRYGFRSSAGLPVPSLFQRTNQQSVTAEVQDVGPTEDDPPKMFDRGRTFMAAVSDAAGRLITTHPHAVGSALIGAGLILGATVVGAPEGAALAGAGSAVLAGAATIDTAAIGVSAAAVATGMVLMNQNKSEASGDGVPSLTKGGRRQLGNLQGTGIEQKSVTDAILSCGGTGSNVNAVSTDIRRMSVAELANRAAQGDPAAATALKIIKQANRLGPKY